MTEINKTSDLTNTKPDDISVKEIFLKIKEYLFYLKTKWIIILVVCLLGSTSGLIYALSKKPIYTADLTFALDEDKGSSGGFAGALGLASTFGVDLGGVSGGGIFSGVNLIELMKSRTLIEKALLTPITVNNSEQSLATYYIEVNKLNKSWGENSELKNIEFKPFADRSKYTLQQDSILGKLYEQITGTLDILSVSQRDKKSNIITIEVRSTDELFSKYFAESIANVVSEYYIETKIRKAKYNYEVLQKQTDSIRNELNMAINDVAIANDNTYNLNPALNIKRTTSAKRQVDVQANTAILTQLVANLEMAKVTLRKETPLIQVIDKPILPLRKEKISKLYSLIIGGILAAFIYISIIIIRRSIQNIF